MHPGRSRPTPVPFLSLPVVAGRDGQVPISPPLLGGDVSETPADLLYTKSHEWVRIDGDEAVIGITDHAQEALNDIVFVELPDVGDAFEEDEEFGVVESVKSVSDLYMPLAGEVVEVNASLEDGPEALNSDPYGEGWLLKVRLTDAGETSGLLSADDYIAFTQE